MPMAVKTLIRVDSLECHEYDQLYWVFRGLEKVLGRKSFLSYVCPRAGWASGHLDVWEDGKTTSDLERGKRLLGLCAYFELKDIKKRSKKFWRLFKR